MTPLGLSLYQFATRRGAAAGPAVPERPAGRLVWLHAPGPEQAAPLAELARHLRQEDGHVVLLTAPDRPEGLPEDVIWAAPPPDTADAVRAALNHWRPDVLMFSGGELHPVLMHEAATRKLPMALVEARAPHLPSGREGWYPGLLRSTLAQLQAVFAVDDAGLKALRKAAAPGLVLTGRMERPSQVLPGNEAEREALAGLMNTRPIWLAVGVPASEEAAIIEAHRAGLRLAHRLLLILLPEDPARIPDLATRLAADESWEVAQRALDEEPDSETEVFLVDASEIGLWYRLSPITFLGGSLAGQGCLRDPMEAAALGSSLIHGPRPGAYGAVMGRLGAGRAARSVGSPADLAEALAELLSPDRAAKLAQAAWAIASDGVEATARVHQQIRKMLGED